LCGNGVARNSWPGSPAVDRGDRDHASRR
jgi:hypothetical protein